MDPTRVTVGSDEILEVKSEIDGTTAITISDWTPKIIDISNQLVAYSGFVKSGTDGSQAIDAYIFAYKCSDDDDLTAKILHKQCTTFDHPNIMRSLGYGRGSKKHSDYMFVAFPMFKKTFSDCLRKASGATEMRRFSKPFIQIVKDIVCGIQALSLHGFGCPTLNEKHIIIKEEGNSITAKIWNFSECNSAGLKDRAWVALGRMLLDASFNNSAAGPYSVEIYDMCRKMIDGKLKGIAILRQSALLTVQEKFENVLVLWRHVSVNCKPQLGHQGGGQGLMAVQKAPPQVGHQGTGQRHMAAQKVPPKASEIKYTLEEYLDLKDTIAERPEWIDKIRSAKSPKTFRELLDELRDILEHEPEYIPPNMTEEPTPTDILDGREKVDLEHWIRKAWAQDFLKIQLWAFDPASKI